MNRRRCRHENHDREAYRQHLFDERLLGLPVEGRRSFRRLILSKEFRRRRNVVIRPLQ